MFLFIFWGERPETPKAREEKVINLQTKDSQKSPEQ